jgi:integration host factor subunit alpha
MYGELFLGAGLFAILLLKNSKESGILSLRLNSAKEARMTKADIVEQVYLSLGLSKAEAAELVDLAFEIIKEALEKGDNVKISGFGSFLVRDKRARRGRNPQTGEALEISPRKVLTFKPSNVLRKQINSGT